jgi:flagellar protein FlaG
MSIQPTASPGAPPPAGAQPAQPRNEAISRAIAEAQAGRAQSAAQPSEAPAKNVKATQEASRQALEDATEKVRRFLEPRSSSLNFSIDEESGIRVVKVIDNQTKELIRQIPSEEMLAIARALDSLQGLLVRQQA